MLTRHLLMGPNGRSLGIRRNYPLRGSGIKCQDWIAEFNRKPLMKAKFHTRDYTSWCGFGKAGDPDSRGVLISCKTYE